MAGRVLLVDDDVELVDMLKQYLEGEGFTVATANDGESGLKLALGGSHDIAVLDVMMPGWSGIEVLARLRTQSSLPVIMLTARGDDADRIVGLELGADDYVPKPCTPRELAARLRAILKRTANRNTPAPGNGTPTSDSPLQHQVGALSVWPEQRRAEWEGQPVELTSTEFNLLEILARHAGQTVSKAELSEQGLGRPLARFDRSIDVHMSSIRHKLGPLRDGRSCIQTVIRKGYQLIRDY